LSDWRWSSVVGAGVVGDTVLGAGVLEGGVVGAGVLGGGVVGGGAFGGGVVGGVVVVVDVGDCFDNDVGTGDGDGNYQLSVLSVRSVLVP
jgi:hypothetical protein